MPGIDERVSAVELAFPRNETALYDEAILEGVANVSDWGGGLVQPDNKTIENTAVIGRQEAVLFTRVGWVRSCAWWRYRPVLAAQRLGTIVPHSLNLMV